MYKYKPVEFKFNPKIESTVRRLRKEQRNSKAVVVMNDLQDMGNLNPHGEMQPINVQGSQEGQNGRIIYRQLGNNNIIHMADDRDIAIRDFAVLTPQVINPKIVRPEVQADNFELKPMMFHMLQTVGQFNKLPSEDPQLHLKLFLEVGDAFKIVGAL